MKNEKPVIKRVIGYVRVSTAEQDVSGLGCNAQSKAISSEAEGRGWELDIVEDRGFSASSLNRPGVQQALAILSVGEAQALVVAKLDRLSRSLLDFAGLMERAQEEGWVIIALDLGLDMSTPSGELMGNVMASFALYERRLIGQRTRDALAAARAGGTRLGGPRLVSDVLRARIVALKDEGATLQSIADTFNEEQVPTVKGGAKWYASTVRAVLRSVEIDEAMAVKG